VFATDRIFSALATLRYRASLSSPTSAHLARGKAAGCFRDPNLIQGDRATDAGGAALQSHVLVAHLPEPQDPDGVTELARFGHVAATMLWPTGTPEFPRAFPGYALSPGGPSGQFSAV
jgi:hypothetical protein